MKNFAWLAALEKDKIHEISFVDLRARMQILYSYISALQGSIGTRFLSFSVRWGCHNDTESVPGNKMAESSS